MGVIKNGILSELKGSVGNVTGRIIHGRNILSRKPGFRKPVNDLETLKRRDRFKLSVKFGAAFRSLNEIKEIWKAFTPEGLNYFGFIVQANYRHIADGRLTKNNLITPYGGFPIDTVSVAISSATLNIEINKLETTFNFNLAKEVNAKLFALIYLWEANNEQADEYAFIPVEFEAQPLQISEPLSFTKSLLRADQVIFENYTNHKVFITLVTLDSNNVPVNFSSSICLE